MVVINHHFEFDSCPFLDCGQVFVYNEKRKQRTLVIMTILVPDYIAIKKNLPLQRNPTWISIVGNKEFIFFFPQLIYEYVL